MIAVGLFAWATPVGNPVIASLVWDSAPPMGTTLKIRVISFYCGILISTK